MPIVEVKPLFHSFHGQYQQRKLDDLIITPAFFATSALPFSNLNFLKN